MNASPVVRWGTQVRATVNESNQILLEYGHFNRRANCWGWTGGIFLNQAVTVGIRRIHHWTNRPLDFSAL